MVVGVQAFSGPLSDLSGLRHPAERHDRQHRSRYGTIPGVDEGLSWRKSTRCGTNACVEVELGPDQVRVRDSKNPAGELTFSAESWRGFLAGVRAGQFDTPARP